MKHKTEELEGALLDAAVAKVEGERAQPTLFRDAHDVLVFSWSYSPSTNWLHGGPIIERERIDLQAPPEADESTWLARHCNWSTRTCAEGGGETPLIAAMRAYVASKFGDEVELP